MEDYEIVAVRGASSGNVSCKVGDYFFGLNNAFKNPGYNVTGGTILQVYPEVLSGTSGTKSVFGICTSTAVNVTGATSGGKTNPDPFLLILRKKST